MVHRQAQVLLWEFGIAVAAVAVLMASPANDARAQMMAHDDIGREMGRDAAIGAGIGLGIGIVRELTRPDGATPPRRSAVPRGTVSDGPRTVAARKDDKKKNPKPVGGGGGGGKTDTAKKPDDKPPVVVDKAPTPVPGEPNGGHKVPGGSVKRNTGPIDRAGDVRTGLLCWVEPDGTAACDFKWFQFVCTEIKSVDRNDGKGPQPPAKVGRAAVATSNGSFLRFGRWSPDDYDNTRGKQREKMFADPAGGGSAPCPEEEMTGGAYDLPVDLPGLPKIDDLKKAKQGIQTLQRIVDAPTSAVAADDIVINGLLTERVSRGSDEQPPDGEPMTIVMVYHFRTALYCNRDCLGFFEWTSTETLTVRQTWARRKDKGNSATGGTTRWLAGYVGERKGDSVVSVGKFKACPPPPPKK